MQSPLDNKIIRALFEVADSDPLSQERHAIDRAAEEIFPGAIVALEAAISYAKRKLDFKNANVFTGALMMLYALAKVERGG